MALEAPSYFDDKDYVRMRVLAAPYNKDVNHSRIISQLKAAAKEFKYFGISPQNLSEPAQLLPVIVVRYKKQLRTFINPIILKVEDHRFREEGCTNIFLVTKKGKKATILITTVRPTRVELAYTTIHGRELVEVLGGRYSPASGVICHEIEHLQGELTVDLARVRLLRCFQLLNEFPNDCALFNAKDRADISRLIPYLLLREGDQYVMRHGSEVEGQVPPASPDVLFFDRVESRFRIEKLFVPRQGEKLPIRISEVAQSWIEKRKN